MVETAGRVIRRNLATVAVVTCHVLVVLLYLGGAVVTEYVRQHYAHGVSWIVAWILDIWFGWATVHRAIMEWVMIQRKGKP